MNAGAQPHPSAPLPAWLWLLAPGVALMPVWRWYLARLGDGSDDPLAIVALAALAAVVARDRTQFAERPRMPWLALALVASALAVAGRSVLPDLLRGAIAVAALSAVLLAVRSSTRPMLAIIGLGLLALPLLSSLQFYVGFPLRALTAEASSWLLRAAGHVAIRDGSALVVEGELVMVDAPCSGIQMGWMAYFTACVAAAWRRVDDAAFLRRLPLVGLVVLLGNIVRNTVLVVKEAHLVHWPEWTHEAVGVAMFAVVCTMVLKLVANCPRTEQQTRPPHTAPTTPPVASSWLKCASSSLKNELLAWVEGSTGIFQARKRLKNGARLGFTPSRSELKNATDGVFQQTARANALLYTLILGGFLALALWPYLNPPPGSAGAATAYVEWPTQYQGRVLRPLALSPVEQRFADHFPGTIGRFQAGEATLVLRQVNAPTRMLHPASDCFRGLGYRISQLQLRRAEHAGAEAPLQRCFIAANNTETLQVCEHIIDAAGSSYTDTSAWYWAALTGQSQGPWQAVTQAAPLTVVNVNLNTR